MAAPAGPNIVAFPGQGSPEQVGFNRQELTHILDLYGRMVAAGEWRDYAMDFTRDCATFAAFRRTADVPQMRLEKRPALHQKQGMWALFGEHGQVLKRGHELNNVLAPVERRLLKAVDQ
ncbi:DUF2794 domain-containing protein [Aurantiacibacter odishensis]|uniref:DUF2794 domain-containing protein n=1 Tax=Aurantiacibacter odishensis TaxID=1155476 RepID=UPI000E7362CE|nr:DUF2794 domain-containing protein [Aurantiacibacter odishensis]